MKLERRHQNRKDMRACLAFVYDQSSFLVGKISTLSIIGLSFEYAGNEVRTTEPMQIDILWAQYTLKSLAGLACHNVYDIKELVTHQTYRGADIRRCGVEFVGLNLAQHADLMTLLGADCARKPTPSELIAVR